MLGRALGIYILFFFIISCQTTWGLDQKVRIICYHELTGDSSKIINPRKYLILDQKIFVQQLEYLRTHGFHFVSVEDIIQAKEGKKKLPSKPVLLTFDDAYQSFYDFAYPILKRLHIPAVLAVVGRWIEEGPPPGVRYPLMSWDEIAQVAKDGLVEIASHSYDLHRNLIFTPQEDMYAAVAVRRYFLLEKRYETREEYLERIRRDFQKVAEVFQKRLGFCPRVMVWPYGTYTKDALDIARSFGYVMTFGLEEGLNTLEDFRAAYRYMPPNNMVDFIRFVEKGLLPSYPLRAVQVDLDLIYDPNPAQTERNLKSLLKRLEYLGVNTVFLQAFRDIDGNCVAEAAYFPNRVLPVKADLFAHVAHQLRIRKIKVFAWMPTLAIKLPDTSLNNSLKLKRSFRQKLSPYRPEVWELLGKLYEDFSTYSFTYGVLFEDDASLTLDEVDSLPENAPTRAQILFDLLTFLQNKIKEKRPLIKVARNIFAPVLISKEAQNYFGQDYEEYLRRYDYTVVMTYPRMEKVDNWKKWFQELVSAAEKHGGINKTVFKLQAYDWRKRICVPANELFNQFRWIHALGAINLAYYPDNMYNNCPDKDFIHLILSTKRYPFFVELTK